MEFVPVARYKTEKASEVILVEMLYQVRDENRKGTTSLWASWRPFSDKEKNAVLVAENIFDDHESEPVGNVGLYFSPTGEYEMTAFLAVNGEPYPTSDAEIDSGKEIRREKVLGPLLSQVLSDNILTETLDQ